LCDAPEKCLRKSAEKYNNKCMSSTVKQRGRDCGCVESLLAAALVSYSAVKSLLMLRRMACSPQMKSCYLKRHDQMLFFNKTILLPKFQRQSRRGLRTSPSGSQFGLQI